MSGSLFARVTLYPRSGWEVNSTNGMIVIYRPQRVVRPACLEENFIRARFSRRLVANRTPCPTRARSAQIPPFSEENEKMLINTVNGLQRGRLEVRRFVVSPRISFPVSGSILFNHSFPIHMRSSWMHRGGCHIFTMEEPGRPSSSSTL